MSVSFLIERETAIPEEWMTVPVGFLETKEEAQEIIEHLQKIELENYRIIKVIREIVL